MRVFVRARVRARAWARAGVCVRLRACLCAPALLLAACKFGRMFTVCTACVCACTPTTHTRRTVPMSMPTCLRSRSALGRPPRSPKTTCNTTRPCNIQQMQRASAAAALPASRRRPAGANGLMDSALPVSSDYAISTSPSARRVVQDVGSAPVAQRPALRDISAGRFGRSAQEGAQLALPLGTSVGAPGSTRAPALGPHRADAIGWRRCGTSSVNQGQRFSCV